VTARRGWRRHESGHPVTAAGRAPGPAPPARALAAALVAVLVVGTSGASATAQERAVGEEPGGDRPRVREAGIVIGALEPGPHNAITDVEGVRVGHRTVRRGDSIRTGVTAILPHGGNLFRRKVPGAVAVGNGFGKLIGSTQVRELGEIETPILLTGTLSVFRAADALVDTMLAIPENRDVRSINPVVGETNDGYLSDVRARPIEPSDVRAALREARPGPVEEGSVGAGTGTTALGWKGGIGTASRILPPADGGWTVGALVQTNYGGLLRVGGVPVWRELEAGRIASERGPRSGAGADRPFRSPGPGALHSPVHDALGGGSVMIVVATDAPLGPRELERLADRTFLAVGRTGSWASHGSGDYAIAFSTVPYGEGARIREGGSLSGLFQAVVEATEEALLNSLFRATPVAGFRGRRVEALPVERVRELLERRDTLRKGGSP